MDIVPLFGLIFLLLDVEPHPCSTCICFVTGSIVYVPIATITKYKHNHQDATTHFYSLLSIEISCVVDVNESKILNILCIKTGYEDTVLRYVLMYTYAYINTYTNRYHSRINSSTVDDGEE